MIEDIEKKILKEIERDEREREDVEKLEKKYKDAKELKEVLEVMPAEKNLIINYYDTHLIFSAEGTVEQLKESDSRLLNAKVMKITENEIDALYTECIIIF